jgi:solute carrier family 25 (mitochondrial iron transporter), member 28/37
MVMVSTNEAMKQAFDGNGAALSMQATFTASAIAGCVAATVTTPLDRIKTALQTQQLQPACFNTVPPRVVANCPLAAAAASASSTASTTAVKHATFRDAARSIWKQEGIRGFFRGVIPRVLSHTPAVAISWTTYETVKEMLMKRYA